MEKRGVARLSLRIDLKKIVAGLKSEIASLRKEVAALQDELKKRPLSIESTQLTTIEGVVLARPIPVTISELPGDDWLVTWPEANLFGSGDTMTEALEAFRDSVRLFAKTYAAGKGGRKGPFAAVQAAYFGARGRLGFNG